MGYLVFSQAQQPSIPVAEASTRAQRLFDSQISSDSPPEASDLKLRLSCPKRSIHGEFHLRVRATEPADLDQARHAEARGRAAGMATLAARCKYVWYFDETDAAADSLLCAILASVALGPVLPPEHDTLFGVRGALERCERALQKAGRET